jgi:transposase
MGQSMEKASSPLSSVLLPTLKPDRHHRGSIRGKAVHRAIRAAGTMLFFLPRYRPGLNPIERGLRQVQTLLCKAAERTVEATWKRIGALLKFSRQLPRQRTTASA